MRRRLKLRTLKYAISNRNSNGKNLLNDFPCSKKEGGTTGGIDLMTSLKVLKGALVHPQKRLMVLMYPTRRIAKKT